MNKELDEKLEFLQNKIEKLKQHEQFLDEYYEAKYKKELEDLNIRIKQTQEKHWKMCNVCAELLQIIDCVSTSYVLSSEANANSIKQILDYLESSAFNRAITRVNDLDILSLKTVNNTLLERSDISKFIDSLLDSRPSAKWAMEKFYNELKTNATTENKQGD